MSPTAQRERLQKIRQHFVEAVDYWRQRAARADEVLTDTIGRQHVVAKHRASEADEAESIAALDYALACLDELEEWRTGKRFMTKTSGTLPFTIASGMATDPVAMELIARMNTPCSVCGQCHGLEVSCGGSPSR